MAFSIFEISRSKGAPVELFRFRYGVFDTDAYCYTNGEQPREHLGLTYRPLPIRRGKIVSTSEGSSQTSLDVDLPGSAEVCELFRVSAPPGVVTLTIFQGHDGDPASEFIPMWTGRVSGCSWEEDGNLGKLMCQPAKGQLRRLALRRHFQYMCPHVLFGDQCRASESAATSEATIYAANGRLITLDTLLPNAAQYPGGMIKWPTKTGVLAARTIMNVATVSGRTRLTLSGTDASLIDGLNVMVVRGCSHDTDGCISHSNIGNYGGQPYIPTSNPLGINGAFS